VITTKSGVRLEALSCDVGSAWGLSPAWCIVDELCQHPETPAARDLFTAVVTGLPKVAGSRLAVITTSGSPGHWSREVFDRAEREKSWRVSMTFGSAPWMDPAEVAEAKRNLPVSAFARLFENRWSQTEDRLFNADDLAACVTLDGDVEARSGCSYVVGVDAALRRDRAVVMVGHLEDRGVDAALAVDRIDVFDPRGREVDLDALEQLIEVRARQYHGATVIYDPAVMQQAAQRLKSRGVRMVEHIFAAASNNRRTLLLLQLAREHRLRLPNDRELIDEMLNVRLRELSPGVYRYDHDSSKHDDRVTALSLVALQLLEHAGGPARTSSQTAARKVLPPTPTSLVSGADTAGIATPNSYAERVARRRGLRVQSPAEQYPDWYTRR
jgi:hypothetical protein